MKFFSKETSEKLAAMGCIPSLGMRISRWSNSAAESMLSTECPPDKHFELFHESDFIGTSVQAKKNCEIICPGRVDCYVCPVCESTIDRADCSNAYLFAHSLLDAPDSEAYLLEMIKNDLPRTHR